MTPTVSILIPYYNDGEVLKTSIQSVLDQTYTDFELILLDHANTDQKTSDIAHSFSDPRIKHVRMEKNLGAGSGLLLLEFLKHAHGKYTKLFCADDVMLSNGLEILVNFMKNNSEKDFAFGNMEYMDGDENPLNENWFHERKGFDITNNETDELVLFSNGVGHLPFPGMIAKTECFKNIPVEKVFILLYDMTLWTQLLLTGYKIGFIDQPVCRYRISDQQLSSASKEEEHFRIAEFEAIEYCKIFMQIHSLPLARKCYPKAAFIDDLKNGDEKFIPFVIAHYYATHTVVPWAISGRQELYKMLSDDDLRLEIESRFGFGIKEFRDIYRNQKLYDLILKKAYPNPKDLKFGELCYLLLRRVYYALYKKPFGKKKKKKKYTI